MSNPWNPSIHNGESNHDQRLGRAGRLLCDSCRHQHPNYNLEEQVSRMNLNGFRAPEPFARYARKFQDLHAKILPSPLQAMPIVSAEVLTRALSERIPSQVVSKLAIVLINLWQSGITGFLSTVIYALENDLCFWPIVQWRESNGVQGMAIFLFEGQNNDKVSWMLHRALPSGEQGGQHGNGWQGSKVTWRVRDIEDIKSICYAAMHFENVLSWTPEETLNLYCHVQPRREISEQEVLKYAEMLYIHIKSLEKMEDVFDEVASQIYYSCLRQGPSTSLLVLTCSCSNQWKE